MMSRNEMILRHHSSSKTCCRGLEQQLCPRSFCHSIVLQLLATFDLCIAPLYDQSRVMMAWNESLVLISYCKVEARFDFDILPVSVHYDFSGGSSSCAWVMAAAVEEEME